MDLFGIFDQSCRWRARRYALATNTRGGKHHGWAAEAECTCSNTEVTKGIKPFDDIWARPSQQYVWRIHCLGWIIFFGEEVWQNSQYPSVLNSTNVLFMHMLWFFVLATKTTKEPGYYVQCGLHTFLGSEGQRKCCKSMQCNQPFESRVVHRLKWWVLQGARCCHASAFWNRAISIVHALVWQDIWWCESQGNQMKRLEDAMWQW